MEDATPYLLGAVALASLAAFASFGVDKRRARRGKSRIPESRLLLFAFLGGFPGAWVGMSFFRHKSRKLSFKLKLAAVTLLCPAWPLLWLSVS